MPSYPVPADNLPPGGAGARIVCGEHDVALFRVGEEFYALENVCPHAGAPLHDGWCEDGEVICPWHGWTFEVQTGQCTTLPGANVATFEVKVENGQVTILVP